MKQLAPMLLAIGLAATWVGCQSSTDSDAVVSSAEDAQAAEGTLVTLKVPNMF